MLKYSMFSNKVSQSCTCIFLSCVTFGAIYTGYLLSIACDLEVVSNVLHKYEPILTLSTRFSSVEWCDSLAC